MAAHLGAWLLSTLAIIVLMLAIGRFGTADRKLLAVLIDAPRNKMSLSQFQVALWTVLILPALAVAVIATRSLEIYVAPEVWALMGLSLGSLAGSVIVKGVKGESTPTTKFQVSLANETEKPKRSVRLLGVLTIADKPRFSDMFKGEELANSEHVDLAKVQMFILTVIAVFGYAVALYEANLSVPPAEITDTYLAYFPKLSESMLTLIGISHAGYLTVKAAPRTPTQP